LSPSPANIRASAVALMVRGHEKGLMTRDEPREGQASTGRHDHSWAANLPCTAVFASDDVGLRRLEVVLGQGSFPVVVASECLTDVLSACKDQRVDVVVVWSGQPSATWQPDVQRLAVEAPTVRIIVVAVPDDGRGVRRALRAGANGFVPSSDADSCLLATIQAAVAGQICVPPDARTQLARPALSHREKKILELIAAGHTNNEIAGRLFLAESTVKTHVSMCFRKLGVTSRADAAAVVLDPQSAVELGLTRQLADEGVSTNGSGRA
jgi:two-component system, NarL family, response regulator DevR